MIKFLSADDHRLLQKGLNALLKTHFPECRLDTADNGVDLLAMLEKEAYDLLLLDINMPEMPFGTFEKIRKLYPDLKILVYSQFPDERFALRYLKKGALGYLNKSEGDEQFITVIKHVLKGNRYIDSSLLDRFLLQSEKQPENNNPMTMLSNREYEIVQHLIAGKSLTEIAQQLGLSISTVSTYKIKAMEKLHVKNLVQLVDVMNEHTM